MRPSGSDTFRQDYAYDKLNRISTVNEYQVTNGTPAELARQLGLKGNEAEKFAKNFTEKGLSDGVELAKLGGDTGRIYGIVQDKLSDQRKEDIKGKGDNPYDGILADCSSTSANLNLPIAGANGKNWSVLVMDVFIENNLTSKSEGDLRIGDVVRYGLDETNSKGEITSRNVPKHFTTFIFMSDDNVPQVFSRSGVGGRFETGSASGFAGKFGNDVDYGNIRGIGRDSTGYYGRR